MGFEGSGSAAELYTASSAAPEAKEISGIASPMLIALIYTAGAAIALGGTVIVMRRRKIACK